MINPNNPTTDTTQTTHGRVYTAWNNKNGASITWEMLCESIGQVLKPHHVEEVCYLLFSAEEGYNHGFCWGNIRAINGIGPVTLEKIKGAFEVLLEMEPEEEDAMTKEVKRMVAHFQDMKAMGRPAAGMLSEVQIQYVEMARGGDADGVRQSMYSEMEDSFFQEICLQMGWMTPAEIDQLKKTEEPEPEPEEEQDENYGRLASVEEYEAELALEEKLQGLADAAEERLLKLSEMISGEPDSEGETLTNQGHEPHNNPEEGNMSDNTLEISLEELDETLEEMRRKLDKMLTMRERYMSRKAKKTLAKVVAETTLPTVHVQTEFKATRILGPVVDIALQDLEVMAEVVTDDGEAITKKDELALLRYAASQRLKALNYARSAYLLITNSQTKDWHAQIVTGTQLRGLATNVAERDMPHCQPAVIHIQNERTTESGQKAPIPQEVLDCVSTEVDGTLSFVMLKESHLISFQMAMLIARTFPKARDFRAYASGLCAPGTFLKNIEVYFDKECLTPELKVEDFKLEQTGKLVPRGNDGDMLIHPDHWILKLLRIDPEQGASFQIRFWDPTTGLFLKGIAYADPTAVRDGKPAVIANPEMVKGVLKGTEMPDGPVNVPYGTVIQVWNRPHHAAQSRWGFSILQQFMNIDEMKNAVETWVDLWLFRYKLDGQMDRYVRSACRGNDELSFAKAIMEAADVNPLDDENIRNAAIAAAGRDFYTLMQGAGMKSPTKVMVADNGMPDTIEVDGRQYAPIAINPEVHIERFPHTVEAVGTEEGVEVGPEWKDFVQNTRGVANPPKGAANLNGRVTRRSVRRWKKRLNALNPNLKLDARGRLVPGQEIVVERIDDVYLPGDIVMVTRYPMVTHQNVTFAVCVTPCTGVLKNGRIAHGTVRMNHRLAMAELFGDFDGDQAIIEGRECVLDLISPEYRLSSFHGRDALYQLEPEKAEADKDPMSKVMMLLPTGDLNPEAIEMISKDGGGPVGELTYLNAMFAQVLSGGYPGFKRLQKFLQGCEKSMAILVQESIDRKKRTTPYSCFNFCYKPENWVMVEPGVYGLPKGDPARKASDPQVEADGRLSEKSVREWAYTQMERAFPALCEITRWEKGKKVRGWGIRNIMTWRLESGVKTLNPCEWDVPQPVAGVPTGLVHHCASYARERWVEEFEGDIYARSGVDFIKALKDLLEEHTAPSWWIDRPELSAKQKWAWAEACTGYKSYNDAFVKALKLPQEAKEYAIAEARATWLKRMGEITLEDQVRLIAFVTAIARDPIQARKKAAMIAACSTGPIVRLLDIKPEGQCRYMEDIMTTTAKWGTGGETRATKWVRYFKKVSEGRHCENAFFKTVREMTGRMPPGADLSAKQMATLEKIQTVHMENFGIPISSCQGCCSAIDRAARHEFQDPNRDLANKEMVFDRITLINKWETLTRAKRVSNGLADFRQALKDYGVGYLRKSLSKALWEALSKEPS